MSQATEGTSAPAAIRPNEMNLIWVDMEMTGLEPDTDRIIEVAVVVTDMHLSLGRAVTAQPEQRYETAEEWLRVLEHADRRELSVRPRPLLEREPLKVWQTLATATTWPSPPPSCRWRAA